MPARPHRTPRPARHGSRARLHHSALIAVTCAAVLGVPAWYALAARDTRTAVRTAPTSAVTQTATQTATETAATATGAVRLPPAHAMFDYQIGGAYTPAAGVGIVERDRSNAPVTGVYTICYLNAFQTQPGEKGNWPADLVTSAQDPGWPGEWILDISTAAKRQAVLAIEHAWLADCKAKGFDAVEPDNLDSYSRSGGAFGLSADEAMARLIVTDAHSLGLAVAQKNTPEIGSVGKSMIGFDFAIAEDCQVYAECDAYTSVYGDEVYEIEYTDDGGLSNFEAACSARGASISIIYRDRDVVPAGRSGYVYRTCWTPAHRRERVLRLPEGGVTDESVAAASAEKRSSGDPVSPSDTESPLDHT